MRTTVVSFDRLTDLVSGECAKREDGGGNRFQRERACRIVLQIVREQLTPKQREYLVRRYFDGETVTGIAAAFGVNKSTVSRTIRLALEKLRDRMRYYEFR